MRSPRLAFLLVLLIVLQSVGTLVDAHRVHQSGTEHLTLEHESTAFDRSHAHADAAVTTSDTSDEPDCPHCCHCHGHCTPAPLASAIHVEHSPLLSNLPPYREGVAPLVITSFLRPPIASVPV